MGDIHLAIVEDDPIIRESLTKYFSINPLIHVELVSPSIEAFITEYNKLYNPKITMMILDIGLPGMNGIQGIYPIKKMIPNVDIIMLTTFEEEEKIFNALCAGACSYLSKRTSLMKIMEALITVHRGGSYMSPVIARKIANHFKPKSNPVTERLTERQIQIVDAIKSGLSYKMIVDKLNISIDTVRDHIKKIYKTLQVNSKIDLINLFE